MRHGSARFRFLVISLVALGQSFCLGFGPPRLAARDVDPQALWPQQVWQLTHMVPPAAEATACLLMDVASQTVLYQKDAHAHLAPASTTKMMTALVALRRGNLADRVTIRAEDLGVGSIVGLSAGEVWTLEDLLYALLLPSDNAVAVVIARHIAGSEPAFVDVMNAQAAEWGLSDTHFVNSHGLDDPQHYSSAYDLAQITLHGLANPVFARIVATPEHQVGVRTLANLNQLIGTYEGAEGVKTGTTDLAGQCLVAVARRPSGRVLSVVLGSTDRYRASQLLMDYYFASYCSVPLQLGPKGLNSLRGLEGEPEVLVLREHPEVVLPRWQLPWLRVQPVYQPGRAIGAPAGIARFSLGRDVLAELPLYASAP